MDRSFYISDWLEAHPSCHDNNLSLLFSFLYRSNWHLKCTQWCMLFYFGYGWFYYGPIIHLEVRISAYSFFNVKLKVECSALPLGCQKKLLDLQSNLHVQPPPVSDPQVCTFWVVAYWGFTVFQLNLTSKCSVLNRLCVIFFLFFSFLSGLHLADKSLSKTDISFHEDNSFSSDGKRPFFYSGLIFW